MNKTTQKSPSELLFGFNITNTSESILNDILEDTNTIATPEEISEMREMSGECIKIQQEKDKHRFDKKRKVTQHYKEGDLVRVERDITNNGGKSKKLVPKYQGPYRILKILPNDRYVIEDTPITKKNNNRRYETVVAMDKIRPWLNLTTDLHSSTDNESSNSDNEV